MLETNIKIINKLGLHARAAAKLVQTTSRFTSTIELHHGTKKVNGKSIMGVMMLAAARGTSLNVIATGDDEKEALDAVVTLINDRFGEAE